MANPFVVTPATSFAMQGLGQLAQATGGQFAQQRQQEQEAQATQEFIALMGQAQSATDPAVKQRIFTEIAANPKYKSQIENMRRQTALQMEQAELAQAGQPEAITPYQRETIDVKKAALEQRKLENQARKLEQQLKREDNELKREELQLKIQDRRAKLDQSQKDVQESLESDLSTTENTLNTINQLKEGSGLEAAVGASSLLPTIPGSEAANFEARLEQLKSQQFLNEVGRLKGMGALSENEGKKLAAAASALDLSMSEDEFKRELDYIEETMIRARNKIAGKLPAKDTQVVNWGDM